MPRYQVQVDLTFALSYEVEAADPHVAAHLAKLQAYEEADTFRSAGTILGDEAVAQTPWERAAPDAGHA